MPHIAIVMPGAHGHINPTIPWTRELVARGARVSYFYTPLPTLEARLIDREVRATGAEVYPYESRFQFKKEGETHKDAWAAFPRRILEDSIDIAERIEETLEKLCPDLVVHDFLCLAGRFAGHALGVPTLTFFPTYAMNEHFPQSHIIPVHPRPDYPERVAFRSLVERVTARFGLPPFRDDAMFVPSALLNIVFMPRAFHPAGDTFDARHLFVGPSLSPRIPTGAWSSDPEPSSPLHYVSLGTVFSKQPDFFRLCLEALRTLPCRVIMSIGDRFDAALLGTIPDNATVAPFVDQLDVLPRCRVFVTHGGMNSVMEALHYRVPMVVMPQIPEQVFTAKWLSERKLAVTLDPEVRSPETIRDAVRAAAGDGAIADSVRAMSRTVRATGGYEAAAAAILAQVEK
jgi:MGT family glycosyltransferase